jgi:GT2 family glycosyltransferase
MQKLSDTADYLQWIAQNDALSASDAEAIRGHIARLALQPEISIVLPVFNTDITFLEEAIQSVINQSYHNWELCIADDASTRPAVIDLLKKFAKKHSNIKVVFRDEVGHVSLATNSAIEVATGEFVAFMGHDDLLAEHALYHVVAAINANPDGKLFYSDEDKIDGNGKRYDPHFKSAWNPLLLFFYNYISHLCVIKRCMLDSGNSLNSEFDGAQDYDLVLRMTDLLTAEEIIHVPFVLYHWRAVSGSTAPCINGELKTCSVSKMAVSAHIQRQGLDAEVLPVAGTDYHRLKIRIPHMEPSIGIIIPTRDRVDLLQVCVEGLLHDTDYDNFSVLIVDNDSKSDETLQYLDEVSKDSRVSVLKHGGPFNFSELNNVAARNLETDYILLLNNDIEVIESSWLKEMVSLFSLPRVAIVGAKLLYPDYTIQHAGVILGIGGVAGHSHKGFSRDDSGYAFRAMAPQDLSAVTGACMLVSREVFISLGGLNQESLKVSLNDIDFCLRVLKEGYRVLWTPYAELLHHESVSRGYEDTLEKANRFKCERRYMKDIWGESLSRDRYYSPNFTLVYEDFSLAKRTRAQRPWLSETENFED